MENEFQLFEAQLEKEHTRGLWREVPAGSPGESRDSKPLAQPCVWKWEKVSKLLEQAVSVVQIDRASERRVLRLRNPGLSRGFCCESIDGSSHNERSKHPAFGMFNSSSCAPVKSGGTSVYSKSDNVPAIPVHFFHKESCLDRCLSQRQSRKQEVRDRRPASRAVAACAK